MSIKDKTVLVVEDDDRNRKLFKTILTVMGCTVLEAGDGRQALDTVRDSPPDLIIMDLQMPVMDGPTAIGILKSDPSHAHIPVMVLTGSRWGDDALEKLRCDGYMQKPISVAGFRLEVARLLELAR